MLPEARERAGLITDVRTVVHLDLTSSDSFGVGATISFGCTRPGASSFLELRGATDVTLDGSPAAYDDGRLALTDLGDFADRPSRVLSRGQKQRLSLARALVHSPGVLLLDEPFDGVDPLGVDATLEVVHAARASGAAVRRLSMAKSAVPVAMSRMRAGRRALSWSTALRRQ